MRLVIFALLAMLAALPAGASHAQTLSPLTGSDAATQQRTPDAQLPARTARQPRMTMQARFDAANTSHDGKLTLDQARAGHMPRVANNFDAIDTKKNGYVTMEDIRSFNRAQRAARHAARQ